MRCNKNRFNRRRFLQKLGVGGALCSVTPSIFAAGFSQIQPPTFIDLIFADHNGYGPHIDAPVVEEKFVPLHKEINLPTMDMASSEYQNTKAILKSEFENTGETWSDDFRLVWSYQHYGVPDQSDNNTHLVKYCQGVQSYLYNRINGLDDLNITWQSLSDGMDVVSKIGNRALVGKFTYFVLRVSAVDEDDNLQETYLVNAKPVNRALHFIDASDGNAQQPDQRLIYVIGGATSLVSPFSEMIHLSTHKPAMRYASELIQQYNPDEAKKIARQSGETVTESAAVIISLDYLYKISNADRARQIVHHAKSLSSQLPAFSNSIAYMQKYGVQKALDVYNESPKEYMRAIARMS